MYLEYIKATVAESVDAGDLKSPGCLGCTGSSPVGGIQNYYKNDGCKRI